MAVDLSVARQHITEALGDNAEQYWNNMKLWYKNKISKQDFDTQARQCLGNDNICFHNEFLLAILAKCQALGSTPASHIQTTQKIAPKPNLIRKTNKVKKQKKAVVANFEHQFNQEDCLQHAPLLSLKDIGEDSDIGLCSYDLMLPDSATIHGRLFLAAWDAGLDNVADETVNLMLYATEYLIKDVISVCCAQRSSFRLQDGQSRYAVGAMCPKLHLRNSVSTWPPESDSSRSCTGSTGGGRTLEQAEALAAVTVASSDDEPSVSSPLSLAHLRDALQIHRRVIPCHTVYAACMERLLSKMSHPSHEELEQNQLHRLEAKRRYERLKQQRSLRL